MARSLAQRILIEHRYRTEFPFPMSTAFYHYCASPTRNNVIRAQRLVRAAESTLRYAAIIAACDYATDSVSNETVLEWVRNRWLQKKGLSFGDWSGVLEKILTEFGTTWHSPFLAEFGKTDRKRLSSVIEPIVADRNRMMGHGQRQAS